MCPNRDNFSTATNDRKRKKALPSFVYISLSRFRMFPVAKSLSTSLLCMLTDGIMCSIMPALSFSLLSLSLFLILCVWEGVSFRNLLKKEPTHAIAQLKNYPLFFKVVLPAIWCVSPPSVNSMCVFLVPINNFANAVKYDYEHKDFVDTPSDFLQFPQLFSNFVCSLIAPPVLRGRREKDLLK